MHDAADVETLSGLSRFRDGFYECLTARADALFELADAAICADGPVTSLVELSLEPVFRRGHGAVYDALAGGAVDEERLRDLLAGPAARRGSADVRHRRHDLPPAGRGMLTGPGPALRAMPVRRRPQGRAGLAVPVGDGPGVGQLLVDPSGRRPAAAGGRLPGHRDRQPRSVTWPGG